MLLETQLNTPNYYLTIDTQLQLKILLIKHYSNTT